MTTSRVKSWTLPLVISSALLFAAKGAHANTYYFPEDKLGVPGVRATFVFTASGFFYANSIVQLRAIADQGDGDPMMYFTRGSLTPPAQPNYRWFDDDGCGDGTQDACINLTIPANGTYWIAVHAYTPATGGSGGKTFHLMYRLGNTGPWSRWGGSTKSWPLGGYAVWTPSWVSSAESYETVLVNDGPTATVLMRYDYDSTVGHYWPTWYDYTSGVGNASKLFASSANTWEYVVISTAAAVEGPTRFLRNDRGLRDADGDGLGDYLEDELCTCSGVNAYACGFWCMDPDAPVDFKDTDGDGIPDYWEAIGCETNTRDFGLIPTQGHCPYSAWDYNNPQYLPRWGASPLHKDVFVEIDRQTSAARFTAQHAQWAADRFKVLKGMQNPDLRDGVALHIDIDDRAYPVNERCELIGDGVSAICGFMGGSEIVPDVPGADQCALSFHMAAERVGIFHWADYYHGTMGSSPKPGDRLCFGDQLGAVRPEAAFTHELGHNLGLEHFGADGAGRANRKPNYPSLMNYSYSYGLNGSTGTWFSDGSRSTQPLDPRNLTEGYASGTDVAFLGHGPFFYPVLGTSVDWNRDGDYAAGGVRAHVSPEPETTDWGEGDDDQPVYQQWYPSINGTTPPQGPAAAYFNGYNYLVASNPSSPYNYKFVRNPNAVGAGWSQWANVGVDPHTTAGSPAAAVYVTDAGTKLFVLGATTSGTIQYATIDLANQVSAWSTPWPNPPGVVFREVSAASTTTAWGSTILAIIARDDSSTTPNELWFGFMHSNLTFYGWNRVQVGGVNVLSSVTPGIADGPDQRLYMLTRAVAGGRLDNLSLYALTAGGWIVIDDPSMWGSDGNILVGGRPALMYRPHRASNGTLLANGRGALWVWYSHAIPKPFPNPWHYEMRYRYTYGPFSASEHDFGSWPHLLSMGRWQWPGHWAADAFMFPALAVSNHPDSLAAFVSYSAGEHPGITHIPYADGQATPGTLINDYDDALTIRDNLCTGLGTCPAGRGFNAKGEAIAPRVVRCSSTP